MTVYELWENLPQMIANSLDIFGIEDFSDVLLSKTFDEAEADWTTYVFSTRMYTRGDVLMTDVGRVLVEHLYDSGSYFYQGNIISPLDGSGYASRDKYDFNDTDVTEYLDHVELEDEEEADLIDGDADNEIPEMSQEELEELLNSTTEEGEQTIGNVEDDSGDDDSGGEIPDDNIESGG